jgi:L-fuculose-phosphate aldolase
MKFDLLPPREQLVMVMTWIYTGGMTTLSGGNLSIRDEAGNLWITPLGVDKGRLTPNDIVCVRQDGTVEGLHPPSSELPFHQAIYRRRPDLHAVVHAHPPALVSFSIARIVPDTRIIPQARRVVGQVGYAPYALPGSEQLGENIAAAFAEGYDAVLLENHGAVAGGDALMDAFQRLETLDFCARTQIFSQGLGPITTLTDEQIELFDHRTNHLPEFEPAYHSSAERELRQQIVGMMQRACDRQLMISTEGVMSARVDGETFLITPTGRDRRSLTNEDIVLIHREQREAGKLPSRSVGLHAQIYRQQPTINAVFTAQSPYVTAYAIAERRFDTKTIPESYILLVDVPKIDYGVLYTDHAAVAKLVSPQRPVLLLQNDCVLTVGRSVLQAFDRLEVAEFTAHSLIQTAAIGDMIPIGAREVADLERKYLQG